MQIIELLLHKFKVNDNHPEARYTSKVEAIYCMKTSTKSIWAGYAVIRITWQRSSSDLDKQTHRYFLLPGENWHLSHIYTITRFYIDLQKTSSKQKVILLKVNVLFIMGFPVTVMTNNVEYFFLGALSPLLLWFQHHSHLWQER